MVYIVKHQDLPAYNVAIQTIKDELSESYELKEVSVDRQNIKEKPCQINHFSWYQSHQTSSNQNET